jgi:hypothetical protein
MGDVLDALCGDLSNTLSWYQVPAGGGIVFRRIHVRVVGGWRGKFKISGAGGHVTVGLVIPFADLAATSKL